MKNIDKSFNSRLKEIVDDIGIEKAAQVSGYKKATIYKWISGDSRAPLDAIAGICDHYGVTVDWILNGGKSEIEEWADVPVWSGLVAGGGGSFLDESRIVSKHKYRRKFIKEMDLHIVQVTGSSMDQGISIRDGDWIAVNFNATKIRDGKVYVLQTGDGFVVKQVFRNPKGGLVLHSTNPDYKDTHMTPEEAADMKVIGEVCEIKSPMF